MPEQNNFTPKLFQVSNEDLSIQTNPHAILLGLSAQMGSMQSKIEGIQSDLKDNKELLKVVVAIQERQKDIVADVATLQSQAHQIDENKAEIKLMRADISLLQADLIKNGEYRMGQMEKFKVSLFSVVGAAALPALGWLGTVFFPVIKVKLGF